MSLQNPASERENDKNSYVTTSDISSSFSRVQSGLEFMLRHFSGPSFPRKISTAATQRKQCEVYDKDMAMLYYQGALWEDCRISGYGLDHKNPDLIFIELDASSFATMRSFKLALTAILKNIEKKIGGHPTVYWSGRGYHIIQPIECPQPLENVKEFTAFDPCPSNKFLQFAERYLSNGKADPSHNPAIKSCMLRVPGSINSKCKAVVGVDPEVKIIQRWDGHRPDYRLLIGSFYADLVGKNNKKKMTIITTNTTTTPITTPAAYLYIEKLLEQQTAIADHRKYTLNVIIIPFLVIIKGMQDPKQIHDTAIQWLDKCAELRRLEPSRRDFSIRVRSRIDEVMRDRVPPMTLDTLKEKNRELYETLNPERFG